MRYYRPIAMTDASRPEGALPLAGGWCWFDSVEEMQRGARGRVIPASDVPRAALERLTARRSPVAGLDLDRPRLMGILNVTPDSFSDGGEHFAPDHALRHGLALASDGAEIVDIGGESTRPGAAEVPVAEEIARVEPLIRGLREKGLTAPVSIDTRKAPVAEAALAAGAGMINDVSALSYDSALAEVCVGAGVPVCLMHAQGSPETMQDDPRYDDVLLDVFDYLSARVEAAEATGIDRARIIVDPGIGFGKSVAHNLALIRGLSLFHGLGCPVLLGASRKRFIGSLTGAEGGAPRAPGSVAVALTAAAQGAQILRVHDVAQTRQALTLWQALTAAPGDDA